MSEMEVATEDIKINEHIIHYLGFVGGTALQTVYDKSTWKKNFHQ